MKLGVNVDHVATLRQARRGEKPDPVRAAQICEQAGCDSIVCHLREDRRHINDQDLRNLRETVKTKLNLEMSCAQDVVNRALEVLPEQATLVPERREEITTEGGLDVISQQGLIAKVVKKLNAAGISVSLFIDPEQSQIKAARDLGLCCVELHTGRYANAKDNRTIGQELENLGNSAKFAASLNLEVFAGHGLDYDNVQRIYQIKEIKELNIGHAIISRAVFVGLENATKQMLLLIK